MNTSKPSNMPANMPAAAAAAAPGGGVLNQEDHLELPPGFRFHPTDEELISHYLFHKVMDCSFSCRAIGDVDLNKSEPWDLPCNNLSLSTLSPLFFLILMIWGFQGRRKWEKKNGIFSV